MEKIQSDEVTVKDKEHRGLNTQEEIRKTKNFWGDKEPSTGVREKQKQTEPHPL